jgi:hypothetical protein
LLLNNTRALIIIFAVTCGLFAHSVDQRAPWFGAIDTGLHEWLTGSTVKFAKNWYREGPVNLKFLMLEEPSSVEFPMLEDRGVYQSYAPGSVLPVYLIAKIIGRPPSAAMVMRYNLLNHFGIAFLLAMASYFLLFKLGVARGLATALSIVPAGLQLNMGAPMYWHQNVYFSDQAVILFFAGIITLEVFREDVRNTKYATVFALLYAVVSFYGTLVDWFFVVVLFVIFLKRCVLMEFGKSVIVWGRGVSLFCLPPALALGLFSLQFGSPLQMLNGLSGIAALRSESIEISQEFSIGFNERIWQHLIPYGYGENASFVLLVAFFGLVLVGFELIRRGIHKSASKAFRKVWVYLVLSLVPCLMHIYLLQNHSWIHDFSVLKFAVFLSIGPFLLVPALCFYVCRERMKVGMPAFVNLNLLKAAGLSLLVLLFICMVSFIEQANARAIHFFAFKQPREYLLIGSLLEAEATYQDIVFSPHIEIPNAPPIMLSYSMKRVYYRPDIHDLNAHIDQFSSRLGEDGFSTSILIDERMKSTLSDSWQAVLQNSELKSTREQFSLYRYQLNR